MGDVLGVLDGVIEAPLEVAEALYPIASLREAATELGVACDVALTGDRVSVRVEPPSALDELLNRTLRVPMAQR